MGLQAVVAAGAVWLGALLGHVVPPLAGVAVIGAGMLGWVLFRARVMVPSVLVGVGVLAGALAVDRIDAALAAPVPQGLGTLVGTAASDATPYGAGFRFVLQPQLWQPDGFAAVDWRGPPVAIVATSDDATVGDTVTVRGLLVAAAGRVRGDPVAGRMTAKSLRLIGESNSPLILAGNVLRDRVIAQLEGVGRTAESSLLAGFLIGDVAALPRTDYEALRRAGLTHYVAVSGSNVALVLGAWWIVAGPLGMGTRARAVTGLAVLLVFVVATRWESSVIRAAAMAGLVLGGRAVGIPIDAWTALGGAVTLLLAVSGQLAVDIGFQLSAAATAGVLLGMRLWQRRSPRVVWATLAATVSAQLAVAPLLLLHFGTVPLLSPIANLVAAPLVTAATALAGVGVITGWDIALQIAAKVAGAVLTLARVAGEWPQLGSGAVVVVTALGVVAWKTRLHLLLLGAVLVVAVGMVIPPGAPPVPTITFLDVGQGDAILLRDPSGVVALVDGGPDPDVLHRSLRRYGVRRIELVVVSHGDADHVGGLTDLESVVDVGRLWVPEHQEAGDLMLEVIAAMERDGVIIDEVGRGDKAHLGQFVIVAEGPRRRYAAENDGSIVLWVEAGRHSVLLPGDIGAVAQREMPRLRPDVLLVPHHGAATSDLDWLADTVGSAAVISVGSNTYGHPDERVLAVLDGLGVMPRLTREEGDISVPLR